MKSELGLLTIAASCLFIVVWVLSRQRSMGFGGSQPIQTPSGGVRRPLAGFEMVARKFLMTMLRYIGMGCPEVQERARRALAAVIVAVFIGQAHRYGTPALLAFGIVPSDYEPVIVSIVFMARSAAAAALIWLFLSWIRYIEHGNNDDQMKKEPGRSGATEVPETNAPDTNQQTPAGTAQSPDNQR